MHTLHADHAVAQDHAIFLGSPPIMWPTWSKFQSFYSVIGYSAITSVPWFYSVIGYSVSHGQVGGRVTWGVEGLDKDRG